MPNNAQYLFSMVLSKRILLPFRQVFTWTIHFLGWCIIDNPHPWMTFTNVSFSCFFGVQPFLKPLSTTSLDIHSFRINVYGVVMLIFFIVCFFIFPRQRTPTYILSSKKCIPSASNWCILGNFGWLNCNYPQKYLDILSILLFTNLHHSAKAQRF